MFIQIYRALGSMLFPLALPFIRRGHEIGIDERRGRYSEEKLRAIADAASRPKKRSNIWVHAVSVGETQAASSAVLSARSHGHDGAITVSTVTVTGAKSAGELIGGAMTCHIYAPWDFAAITRRAVDAIRPTLYAAAESEIWPSLLFDLKRERVPAMLFNGRISDRTWAKRGRAGAFYRRCLPLFDRILARSDEDAARFEALGATEGSVSTAGDAKIDAIISRTERARGELAPLREELGADGTTRIITAGSTHAGEERTVIEAWQTLKDQGIPTKLIIAPRHPERAPEAAALAKTSADAALLSELASRTSRPEVIVIDTVGRLFALYGISDAAFIGGSLVPKGGQNIAEPAAWGTKCAHGPHMEDFAALTAELDASGDAAPAKDARELAKLWAKWLSEGRAEARETIYMKKNRGTSERIWAAMAELEDRRTSKTREI